MIEALQGKTYGDRALQRRLVLVVRADPVICGHSGEARNLAEVALQRGLTDVRVVTWPLDLLTTSGLPLKPLDGVLPYSKGIDVERPEPVGDYRVPDGRYLAGMTGRLAELFTDGVPTICMSLYLSPHTLAVSEALRVARSTGLPVAVATIAEAVGSDVTNVVRSCAADGRFGAAAQVLSAYGVTASRRYPDAARYREHPFTGDIPYTVDHTGAYFLIDKRGALRARMPYTVPVPRLQAEVERLLSEEG